MTHRHLLGVAMTVGVGFTVATLAFDDPAVIDLAKLGILIGSLIAAIRGYLILRAMAPVVPATDSPPHDEAATASLARPTPESLDLSRPPTRPTTS